MRKPICGFEKEIVLPFESKYFEKDAVLFFGKGEFDNPTPMSDITNSGRLTLWGRIFNCDVRFTRDLSIAIFTVLFSDKTFSHTMRIIISKDNADILREKLCVGKTIIANGSFEQDSILNEDVFKPVSIASITPRERKDTAKIKRVELNLHTNMSEMNGVIPASKAIEQAHDWGHNAVAVCDFGTLQAFPEAMKAAEIINSDGGKIKLIYGISAYYVNDTDKDISSAPVYGITILVCNSVGLKNLYKLVSLSYIEYFHEKPLIPRSALEKHRAGLIVGSAGETGELFRAFEDGRPSEECERTAAFYDYLEIRPYCGNQDEEKFRTINRRIAELADKLGKLCAATGDVYYKDKDDAVLRKVLRAEQDDDNERNSLYFRTTDEMLSEFSYFGAEKALELVVTSTNAVADMVEDNVRAIPEGTFMPSFPDAFEELRRICTEKAHKLYGDELPETVSSRLANEFDLIERNGSATQYLIARKQVAYSKEHDYTVGARGLIGSSFAAFLAGITDINPIAPHYFCPKCHFSKFITDSTEGSGYDLPPENCPECNTEMLRDGQDIPIEALMGLNGEKAIDIDLDFSSEILHGIYQQTIDMFGAERVFKAGTISTINGSKAETLANKYCEKSGINLNSAEIRRLSDGITGVKRGNSCHPGGVFVLPADKDFSDFTPIQPSGDIGCNIKSHFEFHSLQDTILKIDLLYNDIHTTLKRLSDMTGINPADVPMTDSEVYKLFTSTEPLGLTESELGISCGTLGIPEFCPDTVIEMMKLAQPKCFSELVKTSGLAHGTGTWLDNARELIANGICSLSDVIALRDDIMNALVKAGFERSEAYRIMEITRKGKALMMFDDNIINAFEEHNLPDWFAQSCMDIRYLFPKAHSASFVKNMVRLAWFKLYKPAEFYAVVLSKHVEKIDYKAVMQGKEAVKQRIAELRDNEGLRLILELMLRGIKLLPADTGKSKENEFTAEDGNVRLPLSVSE